MWRSSTKARTTNGKKQRFLEMSTAQGNANFNNANFDRRVAADALSLSASGPRRNAWIMAALCLEGLVVLGLGIAILRIVNDDVFITMRYSRNLLHGQGLVYTPGERVCGITCPLLAFLQAAFGFVAGGDVLLGNYLLQFLLLAGCMFLAARYFDNPLLTAALIPQIVFNPQTVGYLGNEVVLLLFLSLFSLFCLEKGSDRLFSFSLSLIYLARFDGFIFGALATLYWLYRRRPFDWKRVVSHLAVWASLPVAWHIFSLFYYGHFLSNSVTSKLLTPHGIKTYPMVLFESYLPGLLLGSQNLFLGTLILVGLLIFWRRISPYAAWFIAFSLVYWIIRAPGITRWYFHTLAFLSMFAAAGGIAHVSRVLLARSRIPSAGAFLFSAAAGFLLIGGNLDYSWEKERYELYREVAQYLDGVAAKNARLEMNEIGILGYYLDRPVLDRHFLVTAQGQGEDRFPAIEPLRARLQPAFVLLNPYRILTEMEEKNMVPGYCLVLKGSSPRHGIRLYLFKRL